MATKMATKGEHYHYKYWNIHNEIKSDSDSLSCTKETVDTVVIVLMQREIKVKLELAGIKPVLNRSEQENSVFPRWLRNG